jgi:putative YphP/YqiW family bacilliredoxin
MYPELMVVPMREELTRLGISEARRPEDVDSAIAAPGTCMVVVNSVCGCAAGRLRPAVRLALRHPVQPDRSITVFAGQDREATERARAHFSGYPPSSPALGLVRDGKLVYMLQRSDIENREAEDIAADVTAAFDRFCAKAASAT